MSKAKRRSDKRIGFRNEVATLLRQIRNCHCGKERYKNDPKRTLYRELRLAGIPWSDISQELIWELVNTKRFRQHLQRLQTVVKLAKSFQAEATKGMDDLDTFLFKIAVDNPQLLENMVKELGLELRQELKARLANLTDMVEVFLFTDKKMGGAKEAYMREKRIEEEHTNIPKTEINLATSRLCGFFLKTVGSPKYGLVGQLLYRAELEDEFQIGCWQSLPVIGEIFIVARLFGVQRLAHMYLAAVEGIIAGSFDHLTE